MPLLEIASFTPLSALTASLSGASRIELCRSPSNGGLTPLLSTFLSLRPLISIPIHIMIRPHAHSFVYTPEEILSMEESIRAFNSAGADGFVFGALDERGLVDEGVNRRLVEAAGGRGCTFHRAFDGVPRGEMEGMVKVLVRVGFRGLLTSGGQKTAVEGREVVKRLVERAAGRIEVIVGGGVRAGNVGELRGTGARWFHSSAIVDGGEDASGEEVGLLREALGDE